jgi:hypothetical protein
VITTMPLHLRRYVILGSTLKIISSIKYFQLDVNFSIDIFSQLNFIRLQQYQSIYRQG